MKKFTKIICGSALAALLGAIMASGAAQAERYRGDTYRGHSGMNWDTGEYGAGRSIEMRGSAGTRSARSSRARRGGDIGSLGLATLTGGVGPRPRQWCGSWMRTQLGGGAAYNLAWNWRNYGSSSSPHVGAVVVWRHHVGMITGQASNGQWVVKSGNDSGRVRERARSIAGAVVRA
jgi:hypothetical protein